jgi:hypothetical protein
MHYLLSIYLTIKTSVCFEQFYCLSSGGTSLHLQSMSKVLNNKIGNILTQYGNFIHNKCFRILMAKCTHLSNFKQFHYFQHDTYQLLYIQSSTS